MVRVLITEAHDGLGLALVKEYLAVADNQVVTFCGDETKCDRLHLLKDIYSEKQLLIVTVNLADEESIKASVEPIEGFVNALDLLIFHTGFIPDEFLDDEIDVSEIPKDLFKDYLNKIWKSPSWLKQSLYFLLEEGTNSKIIGMKLCMPRLFDYHVADSLGMKGAPIFYSCYRFGSFAYKVDPTVVTAIHISALYQDESLETLRVLMDGNELLTQEAINQKAKALFENIPKLPYGKHYIMKNLPTVQGVS